jgi:hypothetical protein
MTPIVTDGVTVFIFTPHELEEELTEAALAKKAESEEQE